MEARILAISAAAFLGVLVVGATLQTDLPGKAGAEEPTPAPAPSVEGTVVSGSTSATEPVRGSNDDDDDEDDDRNYDDHRYEDEDDDEDGD